MSYLETFTGKEHSSNVELRIFEKDNNLDIYLDVNLLTNFLNSQHFDFYAFIFHNEIDETDKFPHYHIMIKSSSQLVLKSFLIQLSSSISFSNLELYHIGVIRSCSSFARYLTHKDNSEKYQYSDDKVITNNLLEYTRLSTDFKSQLVQLVRENNNLSLIDLVGVDFYKEYRSVINDIRIALSNDEMQQQIILAQSSIVRQNNDIVSLQQNLIQANILIKKLTSANKKLQSIVDQDFDISNRLVGRP